MNISLAQFFTILIALFALIDPFGGVPVFLAVTKETATPGRIALKSCLFALLVLVVFLFAGRFILNFFAISIPAFQIGGGIIIFLTGLPMLFAYPLSVKALGADFDKLENDGDVSLVPLAVPMLAGPGAITTVMVLTDRYNFMLGKSAILLSVFLVLAFTSLLFWQAPRIFRVIGQTGLNFVTRIMGLVLIVLAVQYILTGIKDFFHF